MVRRRLTVVQLVPRLDGGGVERGTLEVASALVERGHRSVVISGGGRMVDDLTRAGSEHLTWPIGAKSPAVLRWVPRLRRWLARESVDVLHARSRLPAWIGYLAWRGMDPHARPRFVTTVHGLYSVNRYSAVMTRGERVIAVSECARRYVLDHYPGVDPARVVVIPRGVDPAAFPYGYRPSADWWAQWYAQFPALRGRCVLALPGRITPRKGVHAFVELVAGLGDRFAGVIAGQAGARHRRYARALTAQARRLAGERIVFAGHRADMREVLAAADVVVSLSAQPESFGRTVLEALSLGRPVAGYAHGGVGEILQALYPSGAVPPGDLSAMARAVEALRAAPAAVPAEHPYTLARMLTRTLELYESACA